MIEIEKPNITTANLSSDGTEGTFIVEPLERGYGIRWGIPCAACCSARCPA